MGLALAFCMAAVMLCGGLAEVQAAKYKKSFTKDINITGALLQMTIDAKKEADVTVTISTKSKAENLQLNAKMWYADGSESSLEFLIFSP